MGRLVAGCVLCDVLARGDREAESGFVAELSESWVILSFDQFYPGYCILVLKEHEEHLAGLSLPRQIRLWEDVARMAAAMQRALTPARLNYECLGNTVPHVHWHVVPRYADDPRRGDPIWMRPAEERRGSLVPAQRPELVARLRAALSAEHPS